MRKNKKKMKKNIDKKKELSTMPVESVILKGLQRRKKILKKMEKNKKKT
jgi:hypothetical protein